MDHIVHFFKKVDKIAQKQCEFSRIIEENVKNKKVLGKMEFIVYNKN